MVKAKPQPSPHAVDYSLPAKAKAVLDNAFANWRFRTGIPEYENNRSEFTTSPLLSCFMNGDTLPDYAVHIITGRDSTPAEQFIVLLADGESYRLLTLLSRTAKDWDFDSYYSILYKAHYEFWLAPFADEGDPRTTFSTDCIGVLMRDKNYCEIFLLENGTLKSFSPCD
jgi:hypothetical protein